MEAQLSQEKIIAVVLGGGEDALARHAGVAAKALVPLRGKPMGAYVLAALKESRYVDKTVYVGPAEGLEPTLDGATTVMAGKRVTDSLALGLGAALTHTPTRILVLTADIPWVTASKLDSFMVAAPKVDLVYPVISRQTNEAQFPEQKRTYIKVKEGSFTGGNLILMTPAAVPSVLSFMEQLYRGRKNPIALAAAYGWDFVFKLFTGNALTADLEARASKLLGITARGFISDDATLGADIDKPEHVAAFAETAD